MEASFQPSRQQRHKNLRKRQKYYSNHKITINLSVIFLEQHQIIEATLHDPLNHSSDPIDAFFPASWATMSKTDCGTLGVGIRRTERIRPKS